MIKIPRPLTQINNSDITGQLVSSFGLDLASNLGKIKVSPRGILVTSSGDFGENIMSGVPVGFKYFNNKWWTLTGNTSGSAGRVFSNNGIPNGAFTADDTDGTPTDCDSRFGDIEPFIKSDLSAEFICVTSQLSLKSLPFLGVWGSSSGGLTGGPHPLCSYNFRLYVGDGGKVRSTNDPASSALTTSGANFLDLRGLNVAIIWIRAGQNKLWIGCRSFLSPSNGVVVEWNGVSSSFDRIHFIKSNPLACVIKNDIPYIINSNGELLVYNGSFYPIAKLPVKSNKFLVGINSNNNNERFIHPNGMAVVDGKIKMLIRGEYSDGTFDENLPSGVWEYSEDLGLFHSFSPSLYQSSVNDYGMMRLSAVGGLADTKIASSASSSNGNILLGATYYTNATTTAYGIFTNDYKDTVSKLGNFVTTKIESQSIQDVWQKVWVKYKMGQSDKIVVKYRIEEEEPTEATITWAGKNGDNILFNTTTDVSDYEVGDSVEILQGQGAGLEAHIVSTANDGTTYYIELDEDITATGTAKARLQKWIKAGEMSGGQFEELPIGKISTWIQLKIVMTFTGNSEVEEVIIDNKKHQ